MLYQFTFPIEPKGRKKKREQGEEVDPFEDCASLLSFAMGELGLRMHEFYDMPFNEYIVKVEAYNRMHGNKQKAELLNCQFIAYHAYIAGNIRLEKIPSFSEFIGEKRKVRSTMTEEQKERLKAATAEYIKKKSQIS